MKFEAFSLEGKVVFVTGSSRGLGWEMARACALSGATIVLHGRNQDTLDARIEELEKQGCKAGSLCFDMEDKKAVESAIANVVERHGSIWGLVNNAGALRHGLVSEQTVEDYQAILDVHLLAPFVMTREAARYMNESDGPDRGRILNIASIAVTSPRPGIGNYTAAKAAIVGFTRSMSADLGSQGIRCNAIAPGYFATDINRERLDDKVFADKINNRTPAGRWGDPAELGGPAVFLLSEASSYVNGQTLFVDGGMSHFLQAQ